MLKNVLLIIVNLKNYDEYMFEIELLTGVTNKSYLKKEISTV